MSKAAEVLTREFADIGITMDGHVATVEIQRPPHNFFDFKLIEQLADAFEGLDEVDDCRAIVLAADGKNFCAGANFGSGDDDGDDDFSAKGFRTVTQKLYRAGVRLFRTRKPIVGAIQGSAIGGGLGVALVPDFRVCSEDTRFAANFARLGIHPGFGLTVTLPRLVGEQQASLLFYTGRRVPGTEAVAMGLADQLVPTAEIRSAAHALAAEIAECAPLALMSVRATMRQGLADSIEKQTEHELAEQQWLRETEDAQEGIRSVSERRPGNFTGR
ncbi:MAG TPA: enoyl-CoA hydratase/isomerase family protein [Pseudomonadales bacterium]|nr:enoyl-CoA hydratase/isomerase family protein [Pseudomonadales bacterium]